ncbi:TetR/AcrR family transcriptional regulator [Myxococcota bacterium]|nr:TetR/AcrR family transcriptional regulator [Myxococcota bacterium]
MDNRQKKRDMILDSALKNISKHGIRKITLDDISKDIGMKSTALYHYFKSKDEMLLALIDRTLNEMSEGEKKIFQQEKPIHLRFLEIIDYHEQVRDNIGILYTNFLDDLLSTAPLFRERITKFVHSSIQMYSEAFSEAFKDQPKMVLNPAAFSTIFVFGQFLPHMNFFLNLNTPQIICSQEALIAEFRNLIIRSFAE